MSSYIFIFVVGALVYFYIRYIKINSKKNSQIIEFQKSSPEAVLHEDYYISVGAKTPMRYYFYPVYIFYSKESLALYKKIIVEHVMIEEPFHTVFVNILVFLDKNNDYIKSSHTQEFKLKIRNSGEKGSAYLVYSIKELIYETLFSVFDEIKYSHGRHSAQALLLATAFVHLQKMKQWSYLSSETEDEVEQCILIAKAFMKSESWQRTLVSEIIRNIKDHHDEFSFVNFYFERARRFAKEHPYVEQQHDGQMLLPRLDTSIHTKKSLYTIGDFCV